MIKFSVVISVYNKERHLEKTLQSVLSQTYTNFKIIAVNDGSTDNSLNILEACQDPRLQIINQTNQGASATRNKGIKNANSDYVALLDADDIWLPNYLETMADAISKYPKEHVFGCAIAYQYNNRIVPKKYDLKNAALYSIQDYFKCSTYGYTILWSSSIVFNKSILGKTGFFDESIESSEDTDFWVRIGIHCSIVFINKVLAHYNYDDSSLSNTLFNPQSKPKYDNYAEEELKNSDLKKFLDANRYSLAIMSKLHGYDKHYEYYKKSIYLRNLKWRRRLLLNAPKWLLSFLLTIKSFKGEKLYYRPLSSTKLI